jgi:hypothetical protein
MGNVKRNTIGLFLLQTIDQQHELRKSSKNQKIRFVCRVHKASFEASGMKEDGGSTCCCCCSNISPEQIADTMAHQRRCISCYTIAAATLATPLLVLVLWCLSTIPATNAATPSAQPSTSSSTSSSKVKRGLCVIGCTPYVDPSQPSHGIQKYWKLVQEMADTCQVIAHVGDTKPGACVVEK